MEYSFIVMTITNKIFIFNVLNKLLIFSIRMINMLISVANIMIISFFSFCDDRF